MLSKVNTNEKSGKSEKKIKFYETWSFLIIVCILLPLTFRSFAYAPFHIPSASMRSTLLEGDYIFVAKHAYGYDRFSLPFGGYINYFSGKIMAKKPQRGDVIVFRPPKHITGDDYIKRLIGLPGDTIQMKNGIVYINGVEAPQRQVGDYIDKMNDGSVRRVRKYIETLPNGVEHLVLDEGNTKYDNTDIYKVPEGHYFFMGDNRDNSTDSRSGYVGFVPEENLVGRAEVIFLSTSSEIWKIWMWPFSIRKERLMLSIEKAQI